MNRFKEKVVLVTGGNSGIGLASAKAFAQEGAKKVFITGRRQPELDAAVKAIGPAAVAIKSDVSKLSDLDAVFAKIKQEAGYLDVVYANAGIAEFAPLTAITEEHYDKIFDINVKGTVFAVQKALPLLKDGGVIILTSSVVAHHGIENFSIYSATKAAIRNLARHWMLELKGRKIRVNAIAPGGTETPGLMGLVPAENQDGLKGMLESRIPLGRLGKPEQVAQGVLFLASDEASHVNGTELFVDGGEGQY